MNRKKANLLLVIGFFVLGILAVIASVTENTIAKIVMCIGFTTWVTGYFVLSHKFLRCPMCGKWPDKFSQVTRVCSRCGTHLD